MASVSTYLNFAGNTEEVFNFYKSVFKTEFIGKISRFSDIPPQPGMPPIPDSEKNYIMNIALPITGGHVVMGTDSPEAMGKLNFGNNMHICVSPDTREETKRLFDALKQGGQVEMELQDMFWGDYYGNFTDKFGVQWMFNCAEKKK